MSNHVLPKSALLDYALAGARAEYGINYERLTEEERTLLKKDITEIERRIKLVNATMRLTKNYVKVPTPPPTPMWPFSARKGAM